MSSLDTLINLPSTYYRVSLKALVLNDAEELLVVQNEDGAWELPGGGWEHDESIAEGLSRELREELGVSPVTVGAVLFAFQSRNKAGIMTARFVMTATLDDESLVPGDGMKAVMYVAQADLAELPMEHNDSGIKDYTDLIWPAK